MKKLHGIRVVAYGKKRHKRNKQTYGVFYYPDRKVNKLFKEGDLHTIFRVF